MTQSLTAIAAVDMNNALGKNGKIPWSIPSEYAHFRSYSIGKTIIMGKRSFEEIGRPLENRHLFVLTSQQVNPKYENMVGVDFYSTLTDALQAAPQDEVLIGGGGQLYLESLPLLDKIVLSVIPIQVEDADTFFPTLDSRDWEVVSIEQRLEFTINTYRRKLENHEQITL